MEYRPAMLRVLGERNKAEAFPRWRAKMRMWAAQGAPEQSGLQSQARTPSGGVLFAKDGARLGTDQLDKAAQTSRIEASIGVDQTDRQGRRLPRRCQLD